VFHRVTPRAPDGNSAAAVHFDGVRRDGLVDPDGNLVKLVL
jgi:hypothetical protein